MEIYRCSRTDVRCCLADRKFQRFYELNFTSRNVTFHRFLLLVDGFLLEQDFSYAARSRKRVERGASAIACLARRGSLLVMSDRILSISRPFSLLRGFLRWGSSMRMGVGGRIGMGSGRIFGFNLGLEPFFGDFGLSLMASGGLVSGSAIGLGTTDGALGATVPS